MKEEIIKNAVLDDLTDYLYILIGCTMFTLSFAGLMRLYL